ncbi:MAG: DUF2339 domain-containing protein [Clostridiales bacterium]|nr:DUF2339 domain-containing protein [Clostridiales bacterium]
MSVSENLKEILEMQKRITADLEVEASQNVKTDLNAENENLRREILNLRKAVAAHNSRIEILSEQNDELNNALSQQSYNERMDVIKAAMKSSEKIRLISAAQKEVLEKLAQETEVIINSDLTVENESLKAEVSKLQQNVLSNNAKIKKLTEQNTELKSALYDQMYSEKLRMVNSAKEKSDIYFSSVAEKGNNSLTQLEYRLKNRINSLNKEIIKLSSDAGGAIFRELETLSEKTDKLLTSARENLRDGGYDISKYSSDEFEKLAQEQITDDEIEAIKGKNNFEAFLGGNILNKAGIVFVLLGIIAVSQYTFVRLSDFLKGIVLFIISGVFLAGGEMLNRKRTSVFSLGITSAGVAGMYVSLSVSFFALNIMGMYPAIILCILITAAAFALSQRYNSQTIAAFALIGGYLPIISISGSAVLTYGAMVYFVVLNLLALLVSFYKKWKVSMFIGFFLNIIGTAVILVSVYSSLSDGNYTALTLSAVAYLFFAFAIYTLIPILSSYRKKQKISTPDIVILALNTYISAIIMYSALAAFNLSDFSGAVTLLYALVYTCLGRFMEKGFLGEKRMAAMFYLTGLAFVVLAVPLQFGVRWLTLGWLAEGVLIAGYGIVKDIKGFKRAGFIVFALCLSIFVFYDTTTMMLSGDKFYDFYPFKYFAVTLGSIVLLAAFAVKTKFAEEAERIYKYLTLINVWVFCQFLVSLMGDYLNAKYGDILYSAYFTNYITSAFSVVATYALAFVLPHIKGIKSGGTKILSIVFLILGNLSYLILSGFFSLVPNPEIYGYPSAVHTFLAGAALSLLCAASVLSVRSVLLYFVIEKKLRAKWLPFLLSVFFLFSMTQNLVLQFNLSVTNIFISMIYVVAALLWIIYGFIKRFPFLRRFGLGLSVLAVVKLFFVDLGFLTEGLRIVSYFVFGLVLLGISFVYQYFSRKIMPEIAEENLQE